MDNSGRTTKCEVRCIASILHEHWTDCRQKSDAEAEQSRVAFGREARPLKAQDCEGKELPGRFLPW